MQREGRGTWVLTGQGQGGLRTPDDRFLPFAYRSVREMLLILASAEGEPISRAEIGLKLWPMSAPHEQSTNVRQAAYRLRNMLGDRLVSDERGFRLENDFRLEKGEIRETSVETRTFKTGRTGITKEPTPLESFAHLLSWLAEWEPLQMLDLMRSKIDFSLGICPRRLNSLIDAATLRIALNHGLEGWIPFWRGCAHLMSQGVEDARSFFEQSSEHAVASGDYELLAEATLWLGTCEILLRRLGSASRIAERGSHAIDRRPSPRRRARIDHLKGTVLIHQARVNEGIALLEQAGAAVQDRVLEYAINEALRGLYHACVGESQKAGSLLERPNRLAEETGHFHLSSICALAGGYMALSERQPSSAIDALDPVVISAAGVQETHFEIYANEATAAAFWQLGERSEAWKRLSASRRLRQNLKMAYTDWDRLRLRPMVDC